MSDLPARFTIERCTAPSFRDADGEIPRRYLGHDNDGRIGWMATVACLNVYTDARDAKSFRKHRMSRVTDARVVRHTVH